MSEKQYQLFVDYKAFKKARVVFYTAGFVVGFVLASGLCYFTK